MFKALKTLLGDLGGETTTPGGTIERRDLQDAVAGLLHEMIRSDLAERPEEKAAAAASMRALFGLPEPQARNLVETAGDKARRFTSYFGPVSLIKRHYGQPERIALVEHLWRIAYADGGLDTHEDHFVRKIAHLLYVSNTEAMLARARARPAR
ncbi:MAG TPA: TerB family tellurite resistance protein [Pelomicrobium sp.]|nr:TerB family tellurite resistance protein [Pelomicrobium sp.]